MSTLQPDHCHTNPKSRLGFLSSRASLSDTIKFSSMLAVFVLFLSILIKHASSGPQVQVQMTLHRRNYFYVGQTYVPQANSSITGGQMYVEHLSPAKITQLLPLLIIHGNGMTGTNFLNTPDGRPGWADYFLTKGYEVYLVDHPSRGRSPWHQNVDGVQSAFDTFTIQSRFTSPGRFKLWPQASLHTQWPGNGSVGDPTFDNFFASIVPNLNSGAETATKMRAAGSKLLDMIGPVILLTHSQSGQHGWVLGDARPDLIKAIIALEPIGPPFINAVFPPVTAAREFGLTDIPIVYSPPITVSQEIARVAVDTSEFFTCYLQKSPARKLVNLAHIPVLIVTSEAGYHSIYDGCSAQYLIQAGVSVKHINLGDVGIHGNSHMMFMEKNSLQIVDQVVQNWIAKTLYS